MDPPGRIGAARKEKTDMGLIAMTKKPRCRLVVTAAILAVVSLSVAPNTAYAQHRGGGGGGGGGSMTNCTTRSGRDSVF